MGTQAPARLKIAVLSDIHYPGTAERARGGDYETRLVGNPLLRAFLNFYRNFIWLRDPLGQAPQLGRFLSDVGPVDYVVANGDYSCDSGFVGISDPAAFVSAQECIAQLRGRFGEHMHFTLGDHELGKLTFFGAMGGMRLASWKQSTESLNLPPFWKLTLGNYVLLGVTSSLIALPAHRGDSLPEEWPEWLRLRSAHMAEINNAFVALQPQQRVILFCHDPTALPFLWREESVRQRIPQIEQTIIGHIHSRLILWKSRLLSGMPPVHTFGHAIGRFTSALHEAHQWWPFRVRLCPALSGIQLLNDGGYYIVEVDPEAKAPATFTFHPLPRSKSRPAARR